MIGKDCTHQGHSRGLRRMAAATMLIAGSLLAAVPAVAEPTHLSFFSWDNEQVMKPVIAAFEEANPDIRIDFSNAPPVNEYVQTLQTRLLSNTAADVFIIAAENKNALIDGGFVKDLSGYDFIKTMNPQNRAAYGADGKAYGLSLASWGGGILYNKALTDKVGMTEPPKSWDEFLALAKKLKDAGITPYYDGVQSGNLMPLYALIGLAFSKEGGNVDQKIFSGQTSFEKEWTGPLSLYAKLYDDGLISRDVLGLSDDQIVNEFATSKVAMMGAGPWNLPAIRGINPQIEMNFMAVPGPVSGESFLSGAPSPGYAINSATEHLQQAEAFLTFLASPEAVKLYHKSSGAITTTADYKPDLDPALAAIYAGIEASRIYLPMTSWPRAQDALHTEMVAQIQNMVAGGIKPADVGKALDAKLADSQ
ncbi:raffinose/stachyose/melibiose transport system substrate-binding protein [Kaistia soli DSM 19436]|uniref:Raffinose/stachyose/melibiose transport system substrate-binding protein n=2 Tax=Kaistia TaxID=166953 RepID=A0A1M5KNR9_9HYPH|nr:raffinose/stachyose/melibiose transport system substrate-binding protein [Kaistia soli DSM 19436]